MATEVNGDGPNNLIIADNKTICDQKPYEPQEPLEEVSELAKKSETNSEVILNKNDEIKQESSPSKTAKPEPKINQVDPRNKKLERTKKKNEKNFDLFLKSLQNMSLQDQNEVLIKKNTLLIEEVATIGNTNKVFKAKIAILEKEKEQLKLEQNKNFTARTRLENLCRELQKQNKQIKV